MDVSDVYRVWLLSDIGWWHAAVWTSLLTQVSAPTDTHIVFISTRNRQLSFCVFARSCWHLSLMLWHGGWVTTPVDQQTLNPDDDYVLPHQRLWTFDVLVCPLSVTECFLLQPLVYGTVFHRTSLLRPLSPCSAVILNHISSHFLIPLFDSSLICTVPMQWLNISFNIYPVV